MSTAGPPEGVQHRSAQREGTPVSTAGLLQARAQRESASTKAAGLLLRLTASCLAGLAVSAAAQTGELGQALGRALAYDPTYRAAQQERASALQAVPLARAGLLPSIGLSVSDAWVSGSRTAPNIFGQQVTSPLDYRAPQKALTVRQPLFNQEARVRTQQAAVQVAYADALLAVRTHELLDRLGQAWLQRLLARDALQIADVQLRALEGQRQLAQRRLDLGDGTRPEVALAGAELGLARVQRSDALNQLAVAELALTQITGPTLAEPAAQVGDSPVNAELPVLPAIDASQLDAWLQWADRDSPALAVRRYGVELARWGIERAKAGHYPRLDLVGSISKGSNESVSTLNQTTSQRSLSVQLNLPLYSGGSVDATVTQALADQERAQAELDAERLRVQADLQRYLLAASSAARRQAAQQQSLDANLLALEGARKTEAAGVGIVTDILRAELRVAEVRLEQSRTRYERLLALLRLQARVGLPAAAVARLLDQALSASP
jgi:protease secretion system outer membrane protein